MTGRGIGLLAAGALAVLGAAAAWTLAGGHRGPDPRSAARIATGKALYDEHCASCHGAALEGQPDWRTRRPDGRMPAPPHDASGHTWHHPDAVLFAITRDGIAAYAPPGYESDMPSFGDILDDDEIRAVLAYIKSTWPPQIRQRQEEITRASE